MKEIAQEPNNKPIVLVTGAAGSLGLYLVRVLSQAGWQVRAWDKSAPDDEARASLIVGLSNVEWRQANGDDDLDALASGCSALVHAAGLVSLSQSEEDLMEANLDLSRDLFAAAHKAQVEHFVHISCAMIYLAEGGVCIESSPVGAYNAFERSKLAAERALTRAAEEQGAPALTILRPGLLYGPGCTQMGAGVVTLPAILRELSGYLPGLSGGPRTNWCHVEDAAQAVKVVLKTPRARGQTYNVADETALTFGEVLTSVMEGYGFDLGPSVPMPSVALWALISPFIDNDWAFDRARQLLALVWRRVQREHGLNSPLRPRLNKDALFYVRDDAVVVADALRELGWQPAWTDFRQGIAPTIRWYQDHGWAPRFDLEAVVERRDKRALRRFIYSEDLEGVIRNPDGEEEFKASWTMAWESIPWPPFEREAQFEGSITFKTHPEASPLHGIARLAWLPKPRICYEFGFFDALGKARRFKGIRTFDRTAPTISWKKLRGQFTNHVGEESGPVSARFISHSSPGWDLERNDEEES